MNMFVCFLAHFQMFRQQKININAQILYKDLQHNSENKAP